MYDIRRLWRRTISPVESECIYKTRVEKELVNEFFKYGNLPVDLCFECFMNCVYFKLGIMDSRGGIDARTLDAIFNYVDFPLARKCANIGGSDPCRKAYLLLFCLYDDLSGWFPL
ncbi:hypothetical protein ILUMI_17865 [Ignelater luminosus]|uniref:Uncharacterized protein n=1 Tax=Ignelater luminosus TaxID=2038154 RepID=A0A8K0CJ42_IGNLU|nr:hypothetical protein ILUMI_17865 [Ignelater luminosus]